MNVQVKSSNGITLIPVDTRLMANRKIFLEGEIEHQTACEFVKKVMLLSAEDSQKPIDVLINSPGGEINSGMLIYDVIQGSKVPIRMFCLGRAYSMAAVLLACGNHGRYILPNGELMIHEPLLANRIGGTTSTLKSISDSLVQTQKKMNRILSIHTGKTMREIEKATAFDHYFDPEESISFGLCDKIVDFDCIMEGC
ncbi:MAG: ATP-dependent Clp protease proteolytic subunit [Lachnospiraceae bacterium]|nr:ATP-dependent Clp protease proteolytic subunit [Lachnospiraceae bacterium]